MCKLDLLIKILLYQKIRKKKDSLPASHIFSTEWWDVINAMNQIIQSDKRKENSSPCLMPVGLRDFCALVSETCAHGGPGLLLGIYFTFFFLLVILFIYISNVIPLPSFPSLSAVLL
jgi:hypothetical protein